MYNVKTYLDAVKKAMKVFDRKQKETKMANPTAPKAQYAKGKKPAAKTATKKKK